MLKELSLVELTIGKKDTSSEGIYRSQMGEQGCQMLGRETKGESERKCK